MSLIHKRLFLVLLSAVVTASVAFGATVKKTVWTGKHVFTSWKNSIFYAKIDEPFAKDDKLRFYFKDNNGGQIQIAANDDNTETSKNNFTYLPTDQGQGDYDNLGGDHWSYTLGSTMAGYLKDGANYLLIDGHDFTLTSIEREYDDGVEEPPVDPSDVTYKSGRHVTKPGQFPLSFTGTFGNWENKIVIHPEAFPEFDTENHTYTIRVEGSGSVQVGFAKWNSDGEEVSGSFSEKGTYTPTFEFDLSKSNINTIKGGKCLQFNGDGSSVTKIELIVKEGGYVEPPVGKGFHTDGTRLLDANDNEFVMRGINYSWGWNQDKYWQIKSSHDWGFNTVRIQVGSGKRSFCQKPSYNDLKGLIEECENNKLVAVFNVQDITDFSEISDLQYAIDFWCQDDLVGLLNEHVSTVIVNINNEWPARTDQELWRDGYRIAVPALREAGIKNTLMIDCGGWGQDWLCLPKYGKEIYELDPERNIIYSLHMYQTSGRPDDVIEHMSLALEAGCPLCFGELAFEHKNHLSYPQGGPVGWQDILEYSYRHNLSWIGWSWSGNGGGAETCDMFGGSDWQPIENGKCLIYGRYGSKMTSTVCSVYRSNPGTRQPYKYPDPESYANESFSPFPYPGRDNEYTYKDRTEITEVADLTQPYTFERWHNSTVHIAPEVFGEYGLDATLRFVLGGTGEASSLCLYTAEKDNPERWITLNETFSGLTDGNFEVKLASAARKAPAAAEDAALEGLLANGLYVKGQNLSLAGVTYDKGQLTGISSVDAEDLAAPVEYFTLTGIRVAEPQAGQLYICRQGTKVTKIRF